MSEILKQSGVYVMLPDRTIGCFDHLPPQEHYNMERLRHQTYMYDSKPATSVWFGRVHPVEGKSAGVQEEINQQYKFSRVEAWTVHELAAQTNSREYIVPINGTHNNAPGRVIRLENGHLGKVVDLNRQYKVPWELVTDWDSAIGNIAYGPARLPLQLIQNNPSVRAVISIHEDTDHSNYPYPFVKWVPQIGKKDGFYLYDIRAREGDPNDAAVDGQMEALRQVLHDHKFSLFSGVDDPDDPHLGHKVKDGFVRQTVYGKDGIPRLDSTLEMFLVYLGSLGLGNVERAFVVEVPGKMDLPKKREMLRLVTEAFFFPVLGKIGAL